MKSEIKHKSSVYVFAGFHLRLSAVIGLRSLLFNKTVNGFNSIIEKKIVFLVPLYLLNYIT